MTDRGKNSCIINLFHFSGSYRILKNRYYYINQHRTLNK